MNRKTLQFHESRTFALFVLAAFLFLLPGTIQGQEKISLATSVDKSTITIGDLITYTVAVSRDPQVQVKMPSLGENLGGFEIRDYTVHEPRKQNDRILDQVDYIISTFEVGEFEIPPIEIGYIMPGETEQKSLKTESIKIVVESVKPSEEGDIREIKPPWEIPYDWKPVIIIGSIAFLVLLAVLILIIYIRKRRQGKALLPRKTPPPRPPHEVAYEELQRLAASDLLARGKHKRFYSEISEIIRFYVEGRYHIIALELTTTELMDELTAVPVMDKHLNLFRQFLDLCDLVKFAKYKPVGRENEDIMQAALQIVDETKDQRGDEDRKEGEFITPKAMDGEGHPNEKSQQENATPSSQEEFPLNGKEEDREKG